MRTTFARSHSYPSFFTIVGSAFLFLSGCTTPTATPLPITTHALPLDATAGDATEASTTPSIQNAADAGAPASSCTCPSTVPGATTNVTETPVGIDLLVTGASAESVKEIQRRSVSIEQVARHFAMVMEPKGWMADDRFADNYDHGFGDGTPSSAAAACGPPRPCPILARAGRVKVEVLDSGVRISMSADKRDLPWLRSQVKKRVAVYSAPSLTTEAPPGSFGVHLKMTHGPSATPICSAKLLI